MSKKRNAKITNNNNYNISTEEIAPTVGVVIFKWQQLCEHIFSLNMLNIKLYLNLVCLPPLFCLSWMFCLPTLFCLPLLFCLHSVFWLQSLFWLVQFVLCNCFCSADCCLTVLMLCFHRLASLGSPTRSSPACRGCFTFTDINWYYWSFGLFHLGMLIIEPSIAVARACHIATADFV